MDLDAIVVALDDVTRLEQEAESARRAPVALSDLLDAAKLHLARGEELFRASPLRLPPMGGPQAIELWMLGAMMACMPATLKPIVEASLKAGLAGQEAEALTGADRRDRIDGASRRIGQIIAGFSQGDLRQVRNRAAALHATYRGLAGRCTELQERVDERDRQLAHFAEERLSPAGWGDEMARAPLSRGERQAAEAAADRNAIEAEQELAADRSDLADLEAQCEAAAQEAWAARVRRLEELMARRPAAAAA
jgi:hypothetical protein